MTIWPSLFLRQRMVKEWNGKNHRCTYRSTNIKCIKFTIVGHIVNLSGRLVENIWGGWGWKVLVLIHSNIPKKFSNIQILVPEVESYLEGFISEVSCTNSARELQGKLLKKNPFGNEKTWIPKFYYTISNINIVLSNHIFFI